LSCRSQDAGGSNNPDRNAEFEHVNSTVQVQAAIAASEPAVSVDTKKKELLWRQQWTAGEVMEARIRASRQRDRLRITVAHRPAPASGKRSW
jgi:hypothetical protein